MRLQFSVCFLRSSSVAWALSFSWSMSTFWMLDSWPSTDCLCVSSWLSSAIILASSVGRTTSSPACWIWVSSSSFCSGQTCWWVSVSERREKERKFRAQKRWWWWWWWRRGSALQLRRAASLQKLSLPLVVCTYPGSDFWLWLSQLSSGRNWLLVLVCKKERKKMFGFRFFHCAHTHVHLLLTHTQSKKWGSIQHYVKSLL